MSEKNRGNENLHLRSFLGTGKYNIPEVQPCNKRNSLDFISFNYAKTAKDKEKNLENKQNQTSLAYLYRYLLYPKV